MNADQNDEFWRRILRLREICQTLAAMVPWVEDGE